jgi:tetratricopeptide (TPR) repeat protein
MLGMIMQNQGRFKEAAVYYWKVLELGPDSAENHANLGVVLARTGKLEAAINQFKRALDIDNSFEIARDHLETARKELKR